MKHTSIILLNPMISLIADHANLVVLQTFSKAWGLAGMRIGMAFAQPWIIDYMNAVKPPYNVNSYTQAYVLKELDDAENIRREVSVILQEDRKSTRLNSSHVAISYAVF